MTPKYLRVGEIIIICMALTVFGISIGVEIGSQKTKAEMTTTPAETVIQVETVYVPVVEVETEIITEIIDRAVPVEPEDYAALLDMARAYGELIWRHEVYMSVVSEKYPVATEVWVFLTEGLELNDYVAAGIMGNLMNECGGNTLTLYPKIYGLNHGYYGICQWALVYNPQIKDALLEEQLAFLGSTIKETFDKYGYLYKKGFTYADFCALEDCHAASDAFCKVYERPGSSSVTTRRHNATYAYSIFVR